MEENDKEQRLFEILNKPSSDRTEEEIQLIEILVKNVKFLDKFRDTPKMKELCKQMTLLQLPKRELVFNEGDIGENFYIIYKGKVSVFKKGPNNSVVSFILMCRKC